MVVTKIFRYRESSSLLTKLNPAFKLVLTVVFCSIASLGNPVSTLVCLSLAILVWIVFRIPASLLFRGGLFFLFLVLAIGFAHFFNYGDLVSACLKGASFLCVVLASLIFTDCTSPTDLASALGGGTFGAVVGLSVGMIPMIADSFSETLQARRARGESIVRKPVRALTGLCTGVVSKLMDRVDGFSDALIARGFGAKHRPEA